MFNRFNVGGAGLAHCSELMPDLGEIKEALTVFNQLAGYYGMKASVAVPLPRCLVNPRDYRYLRFGHCPSGNHKSYFTIDPYGNLRICNHSPSILGSLLQQDVSELVNHPLVAEFQKASPEVCKGCRQLKKCWGGCKAAAQVCEGGFDKLDPLLKENV
jgi:radical SAM protein with 4Fe4S-binding SPASM domain